MELLISVILLIVLGVLFSCARETNKTNQSWRSKPEQRRKENVFITHFDYNEFNLITLYDNLTIMEFRFTSALYRTFKGERYGRDPA